MNDEQRRRARLDALLEQALDLEDGERERYVRKIERENAAQAAELRELLRFSAAPAPALEAHASARAVFDALIANAADSPTPSGREIDTALEAALPERIGAWRRLRLLGRGGMGAVHLVERCEADFRQVGALKSIRPGIDSEEFLRRFAQERRILASLNHPGIARLLDGGRDERGLPYLVMEFIEGEPLDRYCDAQKLDVGERMALFAEIGRIVAYAHRNLVAHRDLKPSNILVGADGTPKLLDFGIAKALVVSGANAEAMTETALRMFTPDYATPEQVLGEPSGAPADVYQLGLLLYELLSGHRAQQVEHPSQRALEAAVCHREPIKPSERIGDGDREIADARRCTAAALRRKLRGDLDNIVLKALRKAPDRRYGSAMEMVEDIERWQRGMPVRARPETWAYRSGKFVRRNAWSLAAGTAMAAMVVGYAATVTMQADALARERDRAQAEAIKAGQVQRLVLQLFRGADPQASGGSALSARELLDRGWAGIERELQGQPEVRAELLDTVGEAYRQLGEFERAQWLFDKGEESARQLADQRPLLLARALRSRGRIYSDRGEYAAAEPLLRDALRRYAHALGPAHPEVATTSTILADLADRRGDFAQAQSMHRDALAIRRARYGERHPEVAESLANLGMSLRRQGDYAGAEPLLSQALSLHRQLLLPRHPHIAVSLTDLAQVRNDLGEYESAEALYREALQSMRETLGPTHPSVSIAMQTLSRVLQTRRDYPAAREMLEGALAIRKKALGERHPSVALNMNDLGKLLIDTGDIDGAESLYRQALAIYPPEHPWRAMTVFNLGQVAELRGDFAGAERQYRQALAVQRKHYGEEHDSVGMQLNRIGILLQKQGRNAEAEALMRQALSIYRKRFPEGHQRFAMILVPLGTLLLERGANDEARPMLREAWKVRANAFGDRDPRTIEAASALARSEARG